MRVVFRHYKNVGKTRLRRFIDDACATGQIDMYDRPCTPFRSILDTEHVTVCTIETTSGIDPIVTGYAFCRGDVFNKERGRWMARNRALGILSLDPLPDFFKARQEARESAATIRHTENRKLGLERQEVVRMAREAGAEAAD